MAQAVVSPNDKDPPYLSNHCETEEAHCSTSIALPRICRRCPVSSHSQRSRYTSDKSVGNGRSPACGEAKIIRRSTWPFSRCAHFIVFRSGLFRPRNQLLTSAVQLSLARLQFSSLAAALIRNIALDPRRKVDCSLYPLRGFLDCDNEDPCAYRALHFNRATGSLRTALHLVPGNAHRHCG